MTYNTKNYTEQGGEKTVVGGEFAITEEGKLLLDEVELKASEIGALVGGGDVARAAGGHGHLLAAGASDVTTPAWVLDSLLWNEGSMSHQTLKLQAVVAEGDTISFDDGVHSETYEVKVLDQAVQNTADDDDGALTDNPEDVDLKMINAAHGLEAGELILIGTEVMRVTAVNDEWIEVKRAVCGSTIGTHAQNQAVTNGLALDDPGNIPIGFGAGALTNAVSSVRIPATFNELSELPITAHRIANEFVLFASNGVGEYSVTLGETFTEVTNIWMGDWVVGTSPGLARLSRIVHTVTAAEAAAGQVVLPVNFAPSGVVVQIRVAAGNVVEFDGKAVVAATPNRVVLTDDGDASFTAADVITLLVYE